MFYGIAVTFACIPRILEQYSDEIATSTLKAKFPKGRDRLEWHRNQGHRLVLAETPAPMAEAMARVLGMDAKGMDVGQSLVQVGYQDLNEDGPYHGEKERCQLWKRMQRSTGMIWPSAMAMETRLLTRGLCEYVAMQLPSIRKALCKNLRRNRNGKLFIGLPEFIYSRIERCSWTTRHF